MSKSYIPESNTDAVGRILKIASDNDIVVRIWELSDIADIANLDDPDYQGEPWTKADLEECREIILKEEDNQSGYNLQYAIDCINKRKNK